MKILNEYVFCDQKYALIELDDGSKIEIQADDPLAKAAEMEKSGAFKAQIPMAIDPEPVTAKDLSAIGDNDLLAEVKKRTDTGKLTLMVRWIGG